MALGSRLVFHRGPQPVRVEARDDQVGRGKPQLAHHSAKLDQSGPRARAERAGIRDLRINDQELDRFRGGHPQSHRPEAKIRERLRADLAGGDVVRVQTSGHTARFLRLTTSAEGLLVPSVAFLDDPSRWNLVLFLDKLADVTSYVNDCQLKQAACQ